MQPWLVLLRGVNVGGANVIRMADLRSAFSDMGFVEPETYIQSGNVVVGASGRASAAAAREIESGLRDALGYEGRAVVLDRTRMRRVVSEMPPEWSVANADVRYNVLFPVAEARPRDVLAAVDPKPDIESIRAGAQAVYWSAPFATLTRTSMAKLSSQPVYRLVTVRNLTTTLKLAALMDARR
jgi:uncharacterized protein (DUF1697 family)